MKTTRIKPITAFIIIAVIAVTALTSCSSNEVPAEPPEKDSDNPTIAAEETTAELTDTPEKITSPWEDLPTAVLELNSDWVYNIAEERITALGVESPRLKSYDSFDEEYLNQWAKMCDEVRREFAVTVGEIEELGALPMVEYYCYNDTAGLDSFEVRRYITPKEQAAIDAADMEGLSNIHTFELQGSNSGDIADLNIGLIEITEGRALNAADDSEAENGVYNLVISRQFAETNRLKIGSTFTLDHTIARLGMDDIIDTLKFDFTVVGIYESNDPPDDSYVYEPNELPIGEEQAETAAQLLAMSESTRCNEMYTSCKAIYDINKLIADEEIRQNPDGITFRETYLMPIFVFKDSAAMEKFTETVNEMYGERFKLRDYKKWYYYWLREVDN